MEESKEIAHPNFVTIHDSVNGEVMATSSVSGPTHQVMPVSPRTRTNTDGSPPPVTHTHAQTTHAHTETENVAVVTRTQTSTSTSSSSVSGKEEQIPVVVEPVVVEKKEEKEEEKKEEEKEKSNKHPLWIGLLLLLLLIAFIVLTIVFAVKEKNVTITTVYKDHVFNQKEMNLKPVGRSSKYLKEYNPLANGLSVAVPLSDSVESLYSKLTIDQLRGQVSQYSLGQWSGPNETTDEQMDERLDAGQIGSILNMLYPDRLIAAQDKIIKSVGIPLISGFDVIHGMSTIFPLNIAQACSWNATMYQNTTRISGKEARAWGVRWTFAPMVDPSFDPRWGRMSEGGGEDAYINGIMGAAAIEGYQSAGVAACVKHFLGYGAVMDGGKDYSFVDASLQRFLNDYGIAYKMALEAKPKTVMASLNNLNGVPAHLNREINNDLLRGEWGWDGMMVGDWAGISQAWDGKWTESKNSLAMYALYSGVDMSMADDYYHQHLPEEGVLDQIDHMGNSMEDHLRLAARRVLRFKDEMGILSGDPKEYMPASSDILEIIGQMRNTDDIAMAKEASLQSTVLLKNNDGLLPIKLEGGNVPKMMFVGSLANHPRDQVGSWGGTASWMQVIADFTVTYLKGTEAYLTKYLTDRNMSKEDAAAKVADLLLFQQAFSSNIGELTDPACTENCENVANDIDLARDAKATDEALAAIEAEVDLKYVFLFVGENADETGEASSRTNLSLQYYQTIATERITALCASKNIPVIMVLNIGRAQILTEYNVDAIIVPWQSGAEGGNAFPMHIFGDRSPEGRLVGPFPRAMGVIPTLYSRPLCPAEGDACKYVDSNEASILYPLGYGLNYNKYSYIDVRANKYSVKAGETIEISLSVRSEGQLKSAETVQAYISQLTGNVLVPGGIKLRGFTKVAFETDEILKEDVVVLDTARWGVFDQWLKYTVQPGKYLVNIAKDAGTATAIVGEGVVEGGGFKSFGERHWQAIITVT